MNKGRRCEQKRSERLAQNALCRFPFPTSFVNACPPNHYPTQDFRTPPAIVAALTDFQTTMRMVDPTAYRISKTSDVALGLIGGALGDVLDVGCGMGDTGLRMKPRSNRMTGVEISEMAAYKSEKLGIYERVVRGDFAE